MSRELLRDRYGATTVVAFGSLAEGTHFSDRSDIDLVDLDACAAGLRAAILARGVSL